MDLTARHPRTGELLSTVKFMVQPLGAAGELQRELIYDGLRAAEAKGNKGGRRPAVTAAAAVRAGYLGGQSIAGLARDHHVSPAPSVQPSPTLCPSTPVITRTSQHRRSRSSSTCRARSPTSSARLNWTTLGAPRSMTA
ncbi:hypothetical protein [Streptomyces scabichelini]|uniref:hypothetical protein n=1 Tax=Streptomyces scabichelini TaxID=2711217 RepID=UPI001F4A09A4|nr:hypothetical protein [Streptomyces scabichelini]